MTHLYKTTSAVLMAALMVGGNAVYADMWASPAPDCMDSCAVECNNCCNENFWVSGDVLYLTACEGGFGCAFGSTAIESTVSNGQVITSIAEEDRDIDFDWDVGFRVGAGYRFDCSCWDASIYWTHFNENGSGHDCESSAKWKLRFNEVDALLGYTFKYNDCFNIRPFFGARYAKINQSLDTNLVSTVLVVATNASSIVTTTDSDTEHFWGAGPVLGFDANFLLGCGFSVYGNLAGSLLYGEFKDEFNDSNVFTAAVNNCVASKKSCGVLYGLDGGIGVRYEMCYATFQVGLEQHTYFDYNQIGCGGDLNLYGVNASVIVRF